MTAIDGWLDRFSELVKNDKELHDATVKLLLSCAENEMSKAERRRVLTKRHDTDTG